MGEHSKPEDVAPDPALQTASVAGDQPEVTGQMWTKQFWLDTGERAVKSFLEGTAVGLGLIQYADSAVLVSDQLPLHDSLVVGVAMTVASVATSLVSVPFGEKGMPSLIKRLQDT